MHSSINLFAHADGVLYDIGWGQKLLLRCTGEGLPTGDVAIEII